MISIASNLDVFGGFTMFNAFSPKNIPVALMVMITQSLRKSSMFFFQSKLLIYYKRFFYHQIKKINLSIPAKISAIPIPMVVTATVVMSSPSQIGFSTTMTVMVASSSSMFS